MFVGHYGAALALKGVERRASLGLLFLGVQFVDLLFFPFVAAGVEDMSIVPNATPSTHFTLDYLPYTHSLVASLAWSLLAFVVAYFALGSARKGRFSISIVLAISVLSHWVFDLIVHTPDLPLTTDDSTKLGLGLWKNPFLTFGLEATFLVGGLWLYMRSTRPERGVLARYGMPAFVVLLLLVNVGNLFGPPPDNFAGIFVFAMLSYLAFAGMAFWLDRRRSSRHEPAGRRLA